MIRHVTLFTILASLLATTACKKKDGGADPAAKTAEAPKVGCGSDFADPDKQFCIKVPAGYTMDKSHKEDDGSMSYEFQGPQQYFHVLVWGNPQFTYDYQMGVYGPTMKQADHTDVQSGGTPGQTQWWTYKFGTEKPIITALAKSASGMAIQCSADDNSPGPEILDACKSLRPYPGGKPLPAPAAGSGAAK